MHFAAIFEFARAKLSTLSQNNTSSIKIHKYCLKYLQYFKYKYKSFKQSLGLRSILLYYNLSALHFLDDYIVNVRSVLHASVRPSLSHVETQRELIITIPEGVG